MSLTVGSLFSGCGGADLGLTRAGFRHLWLVEKDEFCRSVLARHWPGVPIYDDVLTFPQGNQASEVDLIVGGDPCQEASAARVTAGTANPSLGAEFVRVVSVLLPRFVIRENPTYVRTDAPWPATRFAAALEELGYRTQRVRLRACCFALPHRRDRMFVLARRDAYSHPDADGLPFRLPRRGEASLTQAEVQGKAREWEWLRLDAGAVGGRLRRPYYAGDGGGDDGLSPGFFNARLKALGNALPPPMGEWLGRLILENL